MTLGLLKDFKLVKNSCYNPIVGIINSQFSNIENLKLFISKTNVIVTTISALMSFPDYAKEIIVTECSHLFVDEAHHSEARTWQELIERFDRGKVFLFTATPYRNDGKTMKGDIIYKFSLKDAQKQKYYKEINYLSIREYMPKKADEKIAQKAISQLRKDIKNGYNHILMARCKDKKRAVEVFECYKKYQDLNPVLVYTGVKDIKIKIRDILNRKHNIIVCVNMFGEGFDLPQLKIAAIHDERQSLPITLQFIGRFTRDSYSSLGNASFITNIAYPPIQHELEELYAKDADWNIIIPRLNDNATQKEIDLKRLLGSFNGLDNSMIPFQGIRPAISAVFYRSSCLEWNPDNWEEGIDNIKDYEYKFSTYNENSLVIILGKFDNVYWGNFDTVRDLEWQLIVIYWDLRMGVNRIFINTSMSDLNSKKILVSIFDENISRIDGVNVFRIFHNVKRLSLFNLGARKAIGRDITFQSYYGRGVQDGIKEIEERRLIKNNFFGIGYKEGEKITLGCSTKGKIWSYLRGNLNELITWCKNIGDVIEDTSVDPDTVLRNTLKIYEISSRPQTVPIAIDWGYKRYELSDKGFTIRINGYDFDLSDFELSLIDRPIDASLQFLLKSVDYKIIFEIEFGEKKDGEKVDCYYKIRKITDIDVFIKYGENCESIGEFLQENAPTIWFADGSSLSGNHYTELREEIDLFSIDKMLTDNWTGVDTKKESQGIYPYIQESIQYYFINKIKSDFDIIYDDDGAGEIADIIGINDSDNKIDIHFYHLKFAIDGRISNEISNFYAVCGQAQKSLRWKYKEPRKFFDHLFRRMDKKLNGKDCKRLIQGTEDQLEGIFNAALWKKEMKFHIYIVQPGMSKNNVSADILRLLGVTYHYLYTVGNVELVVYSSE
jgi:hypothetical protein